MSEQSNETTEEQQGGAGVSTPGALPLIATVGAAAAAGAVAIVARKLLSRSDEAQDGSGGEENGDATSFTDLERVAEDISGLVEELRSAAAAEGERDFKRLVQIADAISEYADQAASAFDAAASGSEGEETSDSRVTDDLMERVQGLTEKEREQVAA
jgi:hypothetical protein